MTTGINETHDPNLKSWVESANDPATDFPIQNLPYCQASFRDGDDDDTEVAVVIGDSILRPRKLVERGLLSLAELDLTTAILVFRNLESFAGAGGGFRRALRAEISKLLSVATPRETQDRIKNLLVPLSAASINIQDLARNYTDFYASIHHATTVGAMFRPDNPLLPNYKHVPIGYHGRASSIVVSGTEIRRPNGQQSPPDDNPSAPPTFGPCKLLDYELELGAFVGPGNALGEPISIAQARDHIFGLCLLNDWSARDIQKWEYQPLGPFLAKNFASTISPCIVTMEALAPFRCPVEARPPGDPRPLPYLFDETDQREGALDITLEAYLQSADMEKRGLSPIRLSRGSSRHMYWTFSQLLAHHTSNGCNLQPGDLLGSGTLSGPTPESRGCLLELTWQGVGPDKKPLPRKPIELPTGEKRTFLADGDTVIFKAFCQREGFRRIGFGECRGKILPAKT